MDGSVAMKELSYEDYKLCSDVLHPEFIVELRGNYRDDCTSAAEYIFNSAFYEKMIMCTILCFKNGNSFLDGGLTVWSDLAGADLHYTHHAVLLFGNFIMDVLHSDKLIPTVEYVKQLQQKNTKLRLDKELTLPWFDTRGYPIEVTIERLLTGDWVRHEGGV